MNVESRVSAREVLEETRERRQIIRDCIGALYEAITHEDAGNCAHALGRRQRKHLLNPTVLVTEWLELFEDALAEEDDE